MKKCPQCGRFSEDDASFCPWCGHDLPELPEYPAYGAYNPEPSPYYPARRNRVSIGAVVAVVAVSAILLAVGISMIGMFSDDGEYKDKTVTYRWSVPTIDDSPQFSITVTLSGDEMKTADNSAIERTGTTTNIPVHSDGVFAAREYVVVGDTVKLVSDALWAEFQEEIVNDPSYSSYATSRYFADYVLAFVQEAADYAYDDEAFGQTEYWQYPIETIYRGYGDCEDTSILASAIYARLSQIDGAEDLILGSTLFLLPGHAMAGVEIDGTIPGIGNFMVEKDGHVYYTCETTLDDPGSYPSSGWFGVGGISVTYSGASLIVLPGYTDEYY